eukprot:298344-Pelagomonas_calceolata.AAC.9
MGCTPSFRTGASVKTEGAEAMEVEEGPEKTWLKLTRTMRRSIPDQVRVSIWCSCVGASVVPTCLSW